MGELPPNKLLKKLKISNPNKLMLGHLNINSIRYKCECLTKLVDTFPNAQFLVNSFHPPFRKDRTDRGGGGGGYIYIQEYVPRREIMVTLNHIEAIRC